MATERIAEALVDDAVEFLDDGGDAEKTLDAVDSAIDDFFAIYGDDFNWAAIEDDTARVMFANYMSGQRIC